MSDIIVTLPKQFRWDGAPGKVGLSAWLAEGSPPGMHTAGVEYVWNIGGGTPRIKPGDRVYVCHHGKLIGFAPLVRLECYSRHRGGGRWGLIREGGAVAVTIDQEIPGFRGFRYRWWDHEDERPFDLDAFARHIEQTKARRAS